MSETAHVKSIAVLDAFGYAIKRFAAGVQEPLIRYDKELQRAHDHVQERIKFWHQKTRECEKAYYESKADLSRCQQTPPARDEHGRMHYPDCSSYEREVMISRKAFSEARNNLDRAKVCLREIQSAQVAYKRVSINLRILASIHTQQTLSVLGRYRARLQRYLNPNSGSLSFAGVAKQLITYLTLDALGSGTVFGEYDELQEYISDSGLSGPRGSDTVYQEAHHLMEKRLMSVFGFSDEEGLAVAIHSDEHMQEIHGAEGIASYLPRRAEGEKVVYDIWDVVDGHMTAYNDLERPEWATMVRDYVLQHKGRIIQAYEDGTVSWATADDTARAKTYLETLSVDGSSD